MYVVSVPPIDPRDRGTAPTYRRGMPPAELRGGDRNPVERMDCWDVFEAEYDTVLYCTSDTPRG